MYDQGKLSQAEQFHRKSLALLNETEPEPALVAATLRYLGQVMVAVGEYRYPEARDYFRQALKLAMEHQLAPIALDVCLGVAQLLIRTDEVERAVELLILVEQHEAGVFDARERARHNLIQLGYQLPSEAAQATQAQGERPDLWATAQALLVELAKIEG